MGLQHNLIILFVLATFFNIANVAGTPSHITFEENIGQHPGSSQFVAQSGNFRVGFNNQSFNIYFRNEKRELEELFIQFINANENAKLVPINKQKNNVSYYNGPDASSWFEHIPTFQQLKYDNIYPGIDIVFYGNEAGDLEFDFIIDPDADPGQIQFKSSNDDDILISDSGDILLGNSIKIEAPIIYQNLNHKRHKIPGSYMKNSNGQVSFVIGNYDQSIPLVIDPILSYASYFGGAQANENVADMVVDKEGYVYMTGTSNLTNQFYITKFLPGEPDFELLLWYGTSIGDTRARHIILDHDENIIVDVTTRDVGLPQENPIQTGFGGIIDIYLIKHDPSGKRIFATYIGGASEFPNFSPLDLRGREYTSGIVVDQNNNVFISGETDGAGFPTSGNALYTSNIGNWDLFLMKFSPTGALLYSSFIGGFENDRINTGSNVEEGLAIDSLNRVYLLGYTENPLGNYPASANAFDNAFTGDDKHVLCVFDANNSTFIYSTFLEEFRPAFLKTDQLNRVHMAGRGQLSQLVNPIANSGGQYAAVMSPLTNQVHFSSYIPCENCQLEDIHVGANNDLFFAAADRGKPVLITDSLPEFSPAKRNAYIGQINISKPELVFGMLVGGNENDNPEAIFVNEEMTNLYLANTTFSTNLPATNDAMTTNYPGNGDVYVAIISLTPEKAEVLTLDANPDFIHTGFLGFGKVENIREIEEPEELLNAVRVGRDAVAADGVSEILLKFPYNKEVTDADWKIDEKYGKIETPWSEGTHEVDGVHYFFALYHPPEVFPNKEQIFRLEGIEATKANFSLEIKVQEESEEFQFEVDLVRPPVVLVHGTFDNPDNCWKTPIAPAANNMVQGLELGGFKVFTVNYVTSNGKLDDLFFAQEALESSRFKSNKRVVYENDGGIQDAVDFFRDELNIAVTQADVIGHSMGGILPRVFAAHDTYDTEYKRPNNFNDGDINRMISIASTHSGSELSDFLGFIGDESESLTSIPFIEKFINESVVFATYLFGGIGDTGAVQDQRPMSPALKKIGPTTVPSHAIVCTVDDIENLRANAGEPAFFATYFNFLRALTMIFYFNNSTLADFIANLADRHHFLPPELKNANEKSSLFLPIPSSKVSELRKPSKREEFIDMFNFPLNRFWFVWHLFMKEVVDDWFATEEGVIVTQYETTEINYGDFDDNLQIAIQNEDWSLIEGEMIDPFPDEINQADQVVDFFRYLIFKNAANDCVVRYESQTGGLESPYITEFNNHIHSYAPRYPEIINRCVLLLKSGNENFNMEGFPEAGKDMPIEIPDPFSITAESMIDEETYTGCDAACWSGMVPSHAFVYAEVADILNMVILARPVNPDATAVIQANNATKPMKLKGKSSNWGPQRAFIAEDQRFSKLWFQYQADKKEERDSEIEKYNDEVIASINDPDKFAELRHLEVSYTCDENTQEYKVYFDSTAQDPVSSIYVQSSAGLYYNWVKSTDDQCMDKIECCPLSEQPVSIFNLKPMNVLANPNLRDEQNRSRFYTADYDLLAMAQYAYSLDGLEKDPYINAPPSDEKYIPRFTGADFDSEKGFITQEQNTIVDFINREVIFEANYEGGNVTHHGPENQYYVSDKPDKGSPYVDYPITAFEPDFSRFSKKGVVRSIPKGPPGFRDRYLKRYMAKMRRKGYNLYPNLVANGWQWDHYETYSYDQGWDDRDAPGLDSGPEQIPFPEQCDCNTENFITEDNSLIPESVKSEEIDMSVAYPNPALNVLKVGLLSPVNQEISFSILDITGNRIISSRKTVARGQNTLQVNISHLIPGFYIFHISDESGHSSVLKFIKQSSN